MPSNIATIAEMRKFMYKSEGSSSNPSVITSPEEHMVDIELKSKNFIEKNVRGYFFVWSNMRDGYLSASTMSPFLERPITTKSRIGCFQKVWVFGIKSPSRQHEKPYLFATHPKKRLNSLGNWLIKLH
ncbi:hypothetical protein AVEN_261879-1 [Araneus ventricosus]|uniref:Uncharacterized protein n=1 Tax=Araneus ventricosus TaxID=182803 RepID=A0A4Y2MMM8_ARAVE|nr:hypothetical protein AVEN_261879-1 [Araneus ventricosus]